MSLFCLFHTVAYRYLSAPLYHSPLHTDSKVENAVADISDNVETFIPLNDIDLTPIISRLEKQQVKSNKDKEKLDKMLSNENFVKNAPTNVIEKNRAELAEIIEKLSKIENELTTLKG